LRYHRYIWHWGLKNSIVHEIYFNVSEKEKSVKERKNKLYIHQITFIPAHRSDRRKNLWSYPSLAEVTRSQISRVSSLEDLELLAGQKPPYFPILVRQGHILSTHPPDN
jgi:hypothetical protein